MVDTLGSGSSEGNLVRVRVPPSAPTVCEFPALHLSLLFQPSAQEQEQEMGKKSVGLIEKGVL